MRQYFSGDSYETPHDNPRFILDRVFLGSRWGLYLGLAGEVFHSRRMAMVGEYDDARWAEASFHVMSLTEGCGARYRISGLDNLRGGDGPVVVISNHMSTLETMVFPALIAPLRQVTFVVKQQLVDGPAFGPIMRARNPICVTRTDPKEDLRTVLEEGKRRLDEGISVIVFPQATRSNGFDPDRFNSLGVKLALRAGVPIVPTAIKTDFWGNGRILRGFGRLDRKRKVYIEFGEQIIVTGSGKREHRRTIEFIKERIDRWGSADQS